MNGRHPGLYRAQVRTREAFWRWIVLWCAVAAVLALLEVIW